MIMISYIPDSTGTDFVVMLLMKNTVFIPQSRKNINNVCTMQHLHQDADVAQ